MLLEMDIGSLVCHDLSKRERHWLHKRVEQFGKYALRSTTMYLESDPPGSHPDAPRNMFLQKLSSYKLYD